MDAEVRGRGGQGVNGGMRERQSETETERERRITGIL